MKERAFLQASVAAPAALALARPSVARAAATKTEGNRP